jgi:hypothetical protein
MGSLVTYTTTADAGANPLRVVSVYLAESERLLLVHQRDILNRTARLTLQTLAAVCARMVVALERLEREGR